MIPKIFDFTKTDLNLRPTHDLRMDSILSDNALYFISIPCNRQDILKRQEMFSKIMEDDGFISVQNCLVLLKTLEHTRELLSSAVNELEKVHYTVEKYRIYAKTVEALCSLKDLGDLLCRVSEYFANQKIVCREILDAVKFSEGRMLPFKSGLISLQDKVWITPENNVTDEYDLIKSCAEDLGLNTPKKKRFLLTVDKTLSDSICSMYSDSLTAIHQSLDKFAHINCFEILEYISEFEFIVEIVSLVKKAADNEIKYCFPKISDIPGYRAQEAADITLLSNGITNIVPNDIDFTDDSFSFLMGANSGGKTTYLRAVAVNLIFFLSGCPVFAESAEIFPFEYVDTHFTSDERYTDTGRLDDEMVRVNEMFGRADGKCAFLFFNETFSGTDDKRGFELLKSFVDKLKKNKYFGLWVTHFPNVLTLDEPILTVQVGDNNRRTYRVERSKDSSSSYANDILRKYRIDGESLRLRGRKV